MELNDAPDVIAEAHIYARIAKEQMNEGLQEDAMQTLQKLEKEASSNDYVITSAQMLQIAGKAYAELGNVQKAEAVFQEAVLLMDQNDPPITKGAWDTFVTSLVKTYLELGWKEKAVELADTMDHEWDFEKVEKMIDQY